MTKKQKIEAAAEAMFVNRFANKNGSWDVFKYTHPDIADIFRDNARVALEAAGAVKGSCHDEHSRSNGNAAAGT